MKFNRQEEKPHLTVGEVLEQCENAFIIRIKSLDATKEFRLYRRDLDEYPKLLDVCIENYYYNPKGLEIKIIVKYFNITSWKNYDSYFME